MDGHDSEPAVAMYKTKVNALVTTHDPRRGLLVIPRLRDTSIGQQPSVANGRGAHAVRRARSDFFALSVYLGNISSSYCSIMIL